MKYTVQTRLSNGLGGAVFSKFLANRPSDYRVWTVLKIYFVFAHLNDFSIISFEFFVMFDKQLLPNFCKAVSEQNHVFLSNLRINTNVHKLT